MQRLSERWQLHFSAQKVQGSIFAQVSHAVHHLNQNLHPATIVSLSRAMPVLRFKSGACRIAHRNLAVVMRPQRDEDTGFLSAADTFGLDVLRNPMGIRNL